MSESRPLQFSGPELSGPDLKDMLGRVVDAYCEHYPEAGMLVFLSNGRAMQVAMTGISEVEAAILVSRLIDNIDWPDLAGMHQVITESLRRRGAVMTDRGDGIAPPEVPPGTAVN